MRAAFVLFLLFLLCEVFTMSDPAIAQPLDQVAGPVVRANNQFALSLHGQLDREQRGKNLFYSPTSVSLALAMTAAGARGQTEAEMANVLDLGENLAQAHPYYHKLLEQWNAADEKRPYQLRVANRLWGQKGSPIQPEFLKLTREQYGAEMTLLDFAQSQAAAQEINQWVEKQTNDKITNLVPPSALNAMTRLVLTNAIYFKGSWLKPFDKKLTQDEDFNVSAERKVKMPLMHQKASFGYGENERFQTLEMPYAGRELSMVILLPKKMDGLPELEKALSADAIDSLLPVTSPRVPDAGGPGTGLGMGPGMGPMGSTGRAAPLEMGHHLVDVYVPRFKLEASVELARTLASLGMKRAFSPEADFSGISTAEKFYISAVVHKAFVDVNEEGTEAAAAIAVYMPGAAPGSSGPPPVPVFRADHPFLFLIRDMHSGTILFMGRVLDPTQ